MPAHDERQAQTEELVGREVGRYGMKLVVDDDAPRRTAYRLGGHVAHDALIAQRCEREVLGCQSTLAGSLDENGEMDRLTVEVQDSAAFRPVTVDPVVLAHSQDVELARFVKRQHALDRFVRNRSVIVDEHGFEEAREALEIRIIEMRYEALDDFVHAQDRVAPRHGAACLVIRLRLCQVPISPHKWVSRHTLGKVAVAEFFHIEPVEPYPLCISAIGCGQLLLE